MDKATYQKRLEEIIAHAIERGIMQEHALHDIDPKPYALQAICLLNEEAIGADDGVSTIKDVDEFWKGRNQLRKELKAVIGLDK